MREQGVFFDVVSPYRAVPTVATRDITAAAAQLIVDSSWSDQEEVSLLGPKDLSYHDMAATISEMLGRPTRYQQVQGDAFKENLVGFGLSEPMAQGLLDMMLAKDKGLDNGIVRTPSTRLQLPPRSDSRARKRSSRSSSGEYPPLLACVCLLPVRLVSSARPWQKDSSRHDVRFALTLRSDGTGLFSQGQHFANPLVPLARMSLERGGVASRP